VNSLTQAQPLLTVEVASAILGVTRRITVWLPPRARANDRYPVLYLNDGQNLFDPSRAFAGVTWRVAETASALIGHAVIPPIVIVGIDHGEMRRAQEYLPVSDARNPLAHGPLARKYAEFLTTELMPFIEHTFPVARGPSQTGFGGSSYGAVAALYTAMRMPGTFGRLLLESPSLYVGNGYLLKQARLARRWPQRIYLGVGTEETRRKDWNEETAGNVVRLAGVLGDAGLGPRRLRVVIEPGATHSEEAWARRLPHALEFLYRR
jgi:predicted alpha/beta superfamily hydrolase